MATPIPSVMRMVLFVMPDGSDRAAIINAVHDQTCVSLSVFSGPCDSIPTCSPNICHPAPPVVLRASVVLDQEGKKPGTWHWNEHQIATGKASH